MKNIESLLEMLNNEESGEKEKKAYPKPVLRELSDERIEEIHAMGKITPSEMKQEYEDFDFCPFTYGCSRCREFENCDDCLIDYVNTKEEWDSIVAFLEKTSKNESMETKDNPKMLVLE